MKNKVVVTNNLDKLRNNINNIKYIVNTHGNFQDLLAAFEKTYETLDNIESLISIEQDAFRSNQVI